MHRFVAIGVSGVALAAVALEPASAGSGADGPPELPGCDVTTPKRDDQTGGHYYGNRRLLARPPTSDGVIRARPGDSSPVLRRDGSVASKVLWRGRPSRKRLRVKGRRLDGPAKPLRSRISQHLRRDGVWPGALIWPTTGCWKVVGRVGRTRIAFVVAVVDAR